MEKSTKRVIGVVGIAVLLALVFLFLNIWGLLLIAIGAVFGARRWGYRGSALSTFILFLDRIRHLRPKHRHHIARCNTFAGMVLRNGSVSELVPRGGRGPARAGTDLRDHPQLRIQLSRLLVRQTILESNVKASSQRTR